MKVTLNKEEIQIARDFAELRRQDSKNKGLQHSRGLKSLSNSVDDFSVMGEIAAAKALDIQPILEVGRYHQADLYYRNLPIDVKTSVCKPSFAVPPKSINQFPANTVILYVTGKMPANGADSVTLDAIGVIGLKRCADKMELSTFGKVDRPPAYKVGVNDLTPFEQFRLN